MLEKFTEKALKGVIIAQQEAKKLSHNLIGTEHLLLGLIEEGTGVPVRVLKAVGVTVEGLRHQIRVTFPQNVSQKNSTELLFSNQAIKALKLATDKAKSLGYIYVGSEHVFIALLAQENFDSVMVLKALGVDLNRIKDTVTRITVKRSVNRAHPEIQASKKLAEISKAIQSKAYDLPINLENESTVNIINRAKEIMHNKGNDTIGTEHLLLSMIESNETPVKAILEKEGLDKSKINDYLTAIHSRDMEYEGKGYQLTPAAIQVIESAQEISASLGFGTVNPEHILLAMIKEKRGIAPRILEKFNIYWDELYKDIISPIEKQKSPTLIIIKLAQEEARKLEYNVIGTEHMLLGLLSEGMGIAAQVLNDLGVNLKETRQEVEEIIGIGDSDTAKEMSFTPRAKRLLELAWEEAKRMNKSRIESEHLLLSMTKLKDCMAMKVLTSLGVDSIEIKQGIMRAFEARK